MLLQFSPPFFLVLLIALLIPPFQTSTQWYIHSHSVVVPADANVVNADFVLDVVNVVWKSKVTTVTICYISLQQHDTMQNTFKELKVYR